MEAEALATPGRHDAQSVPTRYDGTNNPALPGPESVEAEAALEEGVEVGRHLVRQSRRRGGAMPPRGRRPELAVLGVVSRRGESAVPVLRVAVRLRPKEAKEEPDA